MYPKSVKESGNAHKTDKKKMWIKGTSTITSNWKADLELTFYLMIWKLAWTSLKVAISSLFLIKPLYSQSSSWLMKAAGGREHKCYNENSCQPVMKHICMEDQLVPKTQIRCDIWDDDRLVSPAGPSAADWQPRCFSVSDFCFLCSKCIYCTSVSWPTSFVIILMMCLYPNQLMLYSSRLIQPIEN